MPMTPQQIQELTDAFNAAIADPTKENIAAYYDVLNSSGFEYGGLAQGVVLDTGFAGLLANNFAENKIENDQGGVFSDAESLSLNIELMERDFQQRQLSGFDRLSGQEISNYHDAAFAEVFPALPSPAEAWTPYYMVRALGDFEVWRTDGIVAYTEIYASMLGAYLQGDVNANRWLQDITDGFIFSLETGIPELGDGVFRITVLEYLASVGRSALGDFFQDEMSKFSSGGVGQENSFIFGGLELAVTSFVARTEDSGGAAPGELLSAGTGVHAVDLALLSESGQAADAVGLDAIRFGIKFDLVQDFDLVANTPDEFVRAFQLIDDATPDSLVVQTTSAGAVEATGEAGNDLIIGVGGNGKFDGGEGEDLIYGGAGHDDALGSEGDDVLIDTTGADLLVGGQGSDNLLGGDGADFLFGADEIDPTRSFQDTPAFAAADPDSTQADVFDGGAGNDLIVTASANSGAPQAQSIILFGEGDGHDVVYLGLGDVIQIKAGTSIAAVESTTRGLEILVEDSPVAFRTDGGDTLLVASGYDAFDDADAATVAVQFLDQNGAVIDEWTLNDVANRVGEFATFDEFPDSYITAYDDHFDERAEDEDPDPSDDGTSGADNLIASGGSDFIIARAGADTVDGQGGDDTIRGGAGDDIIDGGDGNDTIDGGSGEDTITGGAGQDILQGGAGNDVYLVGDSDADIYQDLLGNSDTLRFLPGVTTGLLVNEFSRAGTGIDRIDGTQAAAVVLRGADLLAALDWDFTGMQVTGIAAIEGGSADDNVIGSSAADVILGAGGADVLIGGSGNDDLDGGAGADVLDAGFGNDVVSGGDGDDLLSGGFGSDTLDGGAGIDTVSYEGVTQDLTLDLATGTASGGFQIGSDSLSGIENVIGGSGNDNISGDAGANVIRGGAGDDTLAGGDGEDVAVFSGTFADYTVTLDMGVVTVVGAEGSDTLTDIETLRFDDQDVLVSSLAQITGTSGNDSLTGTAGNDEMFGLDGNDILNGKEGDDLLDGGAGDDSLIAAAGNDQLLGGDGNDRLMGSTGDDVLEGGAGDDELRGGDDDDLLTGGLGADTFLFRKTNKAGNDTVTDFDLTATTGDVIDVSLFGITDFAAFSSGFTQVGADTLITLSGAGESITLSGIDKNDLEARHFVLTKVPQAPTDLDLSSTAVDENVPSGTVVGTIAASDPNDGETFSFALLDDAGGRFEVVGDQLRVASGRDLDFETATSHTILMEVTDSDGLTYEEDFVISVNDVVEPAAITGTSGNDDLTGTAVNDDMFGLEGDDVMNGLDGDDLLDGGAGNDSLIAAAGNDRIIGGDGNDRLMGSTGNDVLEGGAGDDELRGGDDDDLLTGALGADTFLFRKTNKAGADTVTDFDLTATTGDVIDVSLFGFTDFAELSTNFSQDGADTVITLSGAGESIRLVGINSSDLQDSHFII